MTADEETVLREMGLFEEQFAAVDLVVADKDTSQLILEVRRRGLNDPLVPALLVLIGRAVVRREFSQLTASDETAKGL